MQIKVIGPDKEATPIPDPVTVPNPPVIPPVVPPTPIMDGGTKALSAISPVLAASLHPASGNVLQNGLYVPELGTWFTSQATAGTNSSRTPFETTVISRLTPAGALLDSMTLNNAGHGTSIGVEVAGGVTYIFLTYQANAAYTGSVQDVVRFQYQPGTFDRASVPNLTVMPRLDAGYNVVAFDWYNDRVVIRNSGGTKDNYILRRISEWRVGTDVKLATIQLQQAPPVLQGFCTMNDTLFRYIGATNGESLNPPDPTYMEQYSWLTGKRIDKVDYTALGRTALGSYPGATHEPESCTMYREADGTATLCFSVTLDVYPNHQWKMYKLPKIGNVVTVFSGDAIEANENGIQAPV